MKRSFKCIERSLLNLHQVRIEDMGELVHLHLIREQRVLNMKILASNLISSAKLRQIENAIGSILNLEKINIELFYPQSLFCGDCIDYLLECLRERSVPVTGFFDDCDVIIEDSSMRIILKNGGLELLEKLECDRQLSEIIQSKFALGINVKLEETKETDDRNQVINRLKQKSRQRATKNADKIGSRLSFKTNGEPLKGNTMQMLFGKPPKGALVPMKEIGENSGRVTVWGDIFGFDLRETRDGKSCIVTMLVTDYTGSIMVKIFSDIKQAHNLAVFAHGHESGKTCTVAVCGSVGYDKYEKDYVLRADGIVSVEKETVKDNSKEKRVELHAHTKMSALDGLADTKSLVLRASEMGHSAIAVTDHAVVQAFPEAAAAASECAKNNRPIKIIYGVEGYMVDDTSVAVCGNPSAGVDDTLIVFDIETTGFSVRNSRIIEIGAVKIRNRSVVDTFSELVNPDISLPEEIAQLTGITEKMLREKALNEKEALRRFYEFCEADDAVLIAHNASFDISFLKDAAARNGLSFSFASIDTLVMARSVFSGLNNHKLSTLAEHVGAKPYTSHRAHEDAEALAQVFLEMLRIMQIDKPLNKLKQINRRLGSANFKKLPSHHIVVLAKNLKGLKILYEIVTKSHTVNFYKTPRILKSDLLANRDNILLGSACESGELFRCILDGRSWSEARKTAEFYDYLEIQPVENNEFLIRNGRCKSKQELMEINNDIVKLGEQLSIPVVATGDVHFVKPHEKVFRSIIMQGNKFPDAANQPPLYLKTTDEMLDEFSYLGVEKAFEVVVVNPNHIASLIDPLEPIPSGKFPPSIKGSDELLEDCCWSRASELYGQPLPHIVEQRLKREIDSIIKNGFSVMYVAAQKLVEHSEKLGYHVGSRGSVGSSFVATMLRITEVNPLPPHYCCPACKHSIFFTDGSVASGFDMEENNCPRCGEKMNKDGQDIPFETFLGYGGDKQPDIDLNFSGECQAEIHRYTVELFGETQVFKAGTISTVARKTAYGYVKNFLEANNLLVHRAEEERLVRGCLDVKRTTGQHPGGMVIIPQNMDATNFTPLQYPADKSETGMMTTHFDFKALHETILKLDELGHDVPTMYKYLEEYSGINVSDVPCAAPEVISLFTGIDALGECEKSFDISTGTLGLPEMGTSFVRQMLLEAKPSKFSDLVQISGLSHGTNVWLGNAQDLIRSGTCKISDVIGTRDSIMTYLVHRGIAPKMAFDIMEIVRKGSAKEKLTEEISESMKSHGVPQWYIESCKKIKYMFPKAHAVAYVMSATKLGWYKIHYPLAFYAAYFTVRPDALEADCVVLGQGAVEKRIRQLTDMGNERTDKDEDALYAMNVACEMLSRGLKFLPVDLNKSHSTKYIIEEGRIRLPFIAVKGVGQTAAKELFEAAQYSRVSSVDEFASEVSVSKSVIESLKEMGVFGSLPESSQISLF
jgi:DNA polymerase-3 subunit alpha (Gram-positive type)